MGVWQIVWLCMMLFSLGATVSQHGKPKEGTYSLWTSLIAFGIHFGILWAGGFFK